MAHNSYKRSSRGARLSDITTTVAPAKRRLRGRLVVSLSPMLLGQKYSAMVVSTASRLLEKVRIPLKKVNQDMTCTTQHLCIRCTNFAHRVFRVLRHTGVGLSPGQKGSTGPPTATRACVQVYIGTNLRQPRNIPAKGYLRVRGQCGVVSPQNLSNVVCCLSSPNLQHTPTYLHLEKARAHGKGIWCVESGDLQ